MLFKNMQNLVDIVSNLRGTFDFCRPWPISRPMPVAGGGWCWWRSPFVVLSGAVSRTKGGTRSFPSCHDRMYYLTPLQLQCLVSVCAEAGRGGRKHWT